MSTLMMDDHSHHSELSAYTVLFSQETSQFFQ